MDKITLKHIDDDSLCIHRKRYGRGYQFFDESQQKITDTKLLKRLKALVIPPMWDEVHICKWSDGHIQATGRDAKGRKQYIYHEEWERQRQQEKFDRMLDFGGDLPAMREVAIADMNRSTWCKEKVLALMVLLLDDTGLRIGNRQYTQRNGTYGLSTLRRRHLDMSDDDALQIEFIGKKSKKRSVEIDNDRLIQEIQACAELPGYELFRYRDGSSFVEVDSSDVNKYIHHHMGEQYSSKDFRTWVASRMCIAHFPSAVAQKSKKPRSKLLNILLRYVADELGNTPTVCKSYYIHPVLLERVESRDLPMDITPDTSDTLSAAYSEVEKVLLAILQES